MARIILPEDYVGQRTLLENIKAKHEADGSTSALNPILTAKHIDLGDDHDNGVLADVQEKNRISFAVDAENFNQLRNQQMALIEKHLRGMYQFLKSLLKPVVTDLGYWGAIVINNSRLKYPGDAAGFNTMFTTLKAKHDTYSGTTSPLHPYLVQHNISLTDDAATVEAMVLNDKNATAAHKNSEEATQNRKNLWSNTNDFNFDSVEHIRIIGDYLINLYSNNTKKLGQYGYVVDDSPQKPKYRTSKVKPSESITVKNVVLGGSIQNLSNISIQLYKGSTVSGTPITILPNDIFGTIKGFSVITIVNPSTTVTIKFKVLVSQ